MLFNILILFVIVLLGLGGFIGLLMIGPNFLQKKKPSKISLILVAIPVVLLAISFIIQGVSELVLSKPDQKELTGTYHITKVTVSNFDKSRSKLYSLNFKANGLFSLTPIPELEHICEMGKYHLDYDMNYNEVVLNCGTFTTSAHIDRGLGNYRIEFIIGDPDSGESIYFEKDKP